MLRDIETKREATRQHLFDAEATNSALDKATSVDGSRLYQQALQDVDIALQAPELTQGEKQRLLARIVEAVWPMEEGYRIVLSPARQ